jgi:PTS system mannose-specific IIA component
LVGVLIVSHGKLAEALIVSVQFLVGNLQKVKGVSIGPKDREEEIKDRIQEKITEVDDGDGVVILTDLLRGTPTNLCLSFLERERVEVVTGANVPMLLTLLSYRKGRSLEEISKLTKKSGRRSIVLAKSVLSLKRKTRPKSGMSR